MGAGDALRPPAPAPLQGTSVIYFLSFGAVDHKAVGEPSGDKLAPRQEMEVSRSHSQNASTSPLSSLHDDMHFLGNEACLF